MEQTTVFVGNLAWETTEEDLLTYMSKAGEIVQAKIKRHKDSNLSKGWGLVTYTDKSSALTAVQECNMAEFGGRRIHVRLERSHLSSNDGHSVFIKNLPPSMKGSDLLQIIEANEPLTCQILTTMTGRSRGIAVVQYRDADSVQSCIAQLNGKYISGRLIECKVFNDSRLDVKESSPVRKEDEHETILRK